MAVTLNRWIPHYVLAAFDETLLLIKRKQMQDGAGYGTIIRQEIIEHSARVALTMGLQLVFLDG